MKRNIILIMALAMLATVACKKKDDSSTPTPPTNNNNNNNNNPTPGPNSMYVTNAKVLKLSNKLINFTDTSKLDGRYDSGTDISDITMTATTSPNTKNQVNYNLSMRFKTTNTGTRLFYPDEYIDLTLDTGLSLTHLDWTWERGKFNITNFPSSVGQYFTGTFEGVYKNSSNTDSVVITNGKFNVKRKS